MYEFINNYKTKYVDYEELKEKGVFIRKQDRTYFGEMLNERKHGKGIYVKGNYFYAGDFQNDIKHGLGYERKTDGTSYEGEFVNGQHQGFGTYWYLDGSFY